MARSSATFFTLLFVFLVLFAVFETPVAEAKWCQRPSGTWSGVCGNSGKCKDQCIRLEHAKHGSCNYKFPAHRCMCYYEC
ncbi:Defensin-like protein 2 [Ranunculus cassubicifolius]